MSFILCGLMIYACQNETKDQEVLDFKNQEVNVAKNNGIERSDAITSMDETIRRMSGSEFRYQLENYNEEELTQFAADLLINDSRQILLENGYTDNSIVKEFGNDRVKLIHKAIAIYSEINNKK